MINFRFHLISLIAVFLALAVGVVMGYGVLGQPTVDTLQGRVDTVEARANRIRRENAQLRAERARLERLMDELDDFAVTRRLSGSSAVPVAVRGVDGTSVATAVRLARRGGAGVPGIVWLEPKWALTDDEDAAELAGILGIGSMPRAAVRQAANEALAQRLVTAPPVTGRPDLLVDLAEAGFVSPESIDGVRFDLDTYDGRGRRVLLVGGTRGRVPYDRGVVPIARALVDAGALVVVADEWRDVNRGLARGESLAPIRADSDLASLISTIDNFDAVDGPLTAVLALGERAQGTITHYGFGKGAERAVPAWWTV